MATNRVYARNSPLSVTVSSPTVSGDPVVVGAMGGGVALTDYDAVTGKATVDFEGVYDLSVEAVDDAGNSAVEEGDALYYTAGVLSKDSSGVFFGYALEAIDSGETDTIHVRLAQGGGGGAGGASAVPFVSSEQTGTGSNQNVAHGLGAIPSKVVISYTEFLSSASVDQTEGTHTTTNVVVNVTSGVKFKVLAWQ
jgi:hypothetical protein